MQTGVENGRKKFNFGSIFMVTDHFWSFHNTSENIVLTHNSLASTVP